MPVGGQGQPPDLLVGRGPEYIQMRGGIGQSRLQACDLGVGQSQYSYQFKVHGDPGVDGANGSDPGVDLSVTPGALPNPGGGGVAQRPRLLST